MKPFKIEKRTSEKKHFPVYLFTSRKPSDRLRNDRFINTRRDVFFSRALIKERLYIRFGENSATGSDRISLFGFKRQFIEFVRRNVQKSSHLVDKRAGPPRASAVHTLVKTAVFVDENHLGVFAAEFDDAIYAFFFILYDFALGVDFLHESNARFGSKPQRSRTRKSGFYGYIALFFKQISEHSHGLFSYGGIMSFVPLVQNAFSVRKYDLRRRRAYIYT